MPEFKISSAFRPTGDQPKAIGELSQGIQKGLKAQTLLGVTGSGKTFTMACVIEKTQKPTLVIAHNKTLAAQLATEFKEFFPDNAVEYFVSYYDYYQPEAYLPRTDTYIEKDADINEELDKLRHSATRSLLTRNDVLIVASVSCIFGLGSPDEYQSFVIDIEKGDTFIRSSLISKLIDMQYERNDYDLSRGRFRVKGDTLDILPAYEELGVRIQFWGDEIEGIILLDPLTGEILSEKNSISIYPAKHFVTSEEKLKLAVKNIKLELSEHLDFLKKNNKLLEAQRLESRTNYDLEMLEVAGYCSGVENYSRHLSQREAGSTPHTLMDYLPDNFLLFVDESHMTLPQVRGMYQGDRSRKETLVEHGFRLPSALDNRPLNFNEFENRIEQVVYVSATPSEYEIKNSGNVTEQIIRPTGLLDPIIDIKPVNGQIDDLLNEIRLRINKKERCLVTTLTKRMSEELSDYLKESGIKTHYLHSEIDTLERSEILRDLRSGVFDVIVGINLL
ncbi:MAG: excinuclease ABC subunit B, partial [Dehalococcoidia bacterium]|nr:excinuclease ABC subunit B [Dehalococcoidia bacterium]